MQNEKNPTKAPVCSELKSWEMPVRGKKKNPEGPQTLQTGDLPPFDLPAEEEDMLAEAA